MRWKPPAEYRLANDVEFVIDNYGNVTITKGTENGNAELSDNTITLYDTMMDAEEVEQREAVKPPARCRWARFWPRPAICCDPGYRCHRAGEPDRPYRGRPSAP